ncbi:MAG TPA: lipid II flippase MurJ [Capillimicrobium sp.]|nr:lipid II flippase MurJ [Capillimicrobium sp.]
MASVAESRERSQRAFLRASGIIGILTLLSRLAGFVREALIAKTFGTTATGSALVVAQTVPNLARSLVSEDVAQGALVPRLGRLLEQGDDQQATRVAMWTAAFATFFLVAVSGAMLIAAHSIVRLTAPGEGDAFAVEAAPLLKLMLPAVCINGVLAASSAFLTAHRGFAAVGAGAFVSNVPILVLLLVGTSSAEAVAVTLALGYVGQGVYLIVAARRYRGPRIATRPVPWRELRRVGGLAVPVMFSLGLASLSGVVDVAFSTLAGTGGPAALDKAFRLVMVPYGVFAMAIGIVALPNMVREAITGGAAFDREVMRATRLQAVILVPLAVATGCFATEFVRIAYERGEFDAASTALTADALIGVSFALPALGLSMVATRSWLSRQKPWVPARLAMLGLLANAGLNAALVGPLGVAGIGISTAIVHGTIGSVLIVSGAASKGAIVRELRGFAIRFGIAVLAGVLAGWLTFSLAGGLPEIAAAGASVAVGSLALVAIASFVRLPDYGEMAAAFRRRG